MPSHPDRVKNNYIALCELCLRNPIYLFASRSYLAINRYNICLECLDELHERIAIQMSKLGETYD